MGVMMSGLKIRQKYMRSFAGLDKNSRLFAWMIFLSYVGQVGLSILLGHALLAFPVSFVSVVLMGCCALFVATRFRGLNNIVHECSHITFCADRPTNVLLGSLSASVVLGSYQDYRDEHLTHHQHLGDYDHDLDLQGLKDLRLHDPLTFGTVVRHIYTPLIGRHLPYYLSVNLSGRDGLGFLALKLGLLAATAGLLVVAPLTALLFVIVPFVWIYSTLNYWTDCLDHAGLLSSEDELDASRNILAPGFIRVLFFPRNDCYHLVHHLFPHVPAHHLDECHQVLEGDAVYCSKQHAARLTDVKLPIIGNAKTT